MKFNEKLAQMRKNNNMSQEQLADRLGVSRQAISKWESGTSMPDMAKILELCKILNCSLEELIDDGINRNTHENNNQKVDINNYIKELLDFITKTINMFWSMTFTEKLKCIIEILALIFIIFIIWGMAGSIVSGIFENLLRLLPDNVYQFIYSFCSVIYGLFGFVSGLLIVIHAFKIRYLDYFITIEDESAQNKTRELSIEDENLDNSKVKFIENKKNKIIIRDPKHSTYSFFKILGKIFIKITKVILLFIAIPCLISFISLVFGLIFSIWFLKNGIFFAGIAIIILGLIFINYLIIRFIYNFILNIKTKYNLLFAILIAGLTLIGLGSAISFCTYLNFDKKVITNKDIKHTTNTYNLKMEDNLILDFIEDDASKIVINNSNNDIKVEVFKENNSTVNIYDYKDETYDYDDDDDGSTNNKVFKVYSFRYAQDTDSELDQINKVLNQLKKKQRIEDEHKRISQIKITISQANYDKLKKNYQELYD